MNWLRRLFASRDHARRASAALEQRRADLRAKALEAERRGDDRDLGKYRMLLQQATHEALRGAR